MDEGEKSTLNCAPPFWRLITSCFTSISFFTTHDPPMKLPNGINICGGLLFYKAVNTMNKFEMVCQTCNAVTKDVDFRSSVIYDMIIFVKCSQCHEEEKYYWDMQKVEE
jgi:hypothetical protein